MVQREISGETLTYSLGGDFERNLYAKSEGIGICVFCEQRPTFGIV